MHDAIGSCSVCIFKDLPAIYYGYLQGSRAVEPRSDQREKWGSAGTAWFGYIFPKPAMLCMFFLCSLVFDWVQTYSSKFCVPQQTYWVIWKKMVFCPVRSAEKENNGMPVHVWTRPVAWLMKHIICQSRMPFWQAFPLFYINLFVLPPALQFLE